MCLDLCVWKFHFTKAVITHISTRCPQCPSHLLLTGSSDSLASRLPLQMVPMVLNEVLDMALIKDAPAQPESLFLTSQVAHLCLLYLLVHHTWGGRMEWDIHSGSLKEWQRREDAFSVRWGEPNTLQGMPTVWKTIYFLSPKWAQPSLLPIPKWNTCPLLKIMFAYDKTKKSLERVMKIMFIPYLLLVLICWLNMDTTDLTRLLLQVSVWNSVSFYMFTRNKNQDVWNICDLSKMVPIFT